MTEIDQNLAATKGVRYLPLDMVVKLPIDTLLERIETIANRNQTPDPVEVAALLGTKQLAALTVTQALETDWGLAKQNLWQKRRPEAPLGEPTHEGCPEFCQLCR